MTLHFFLTKLGRALFTLWLVVTFVFIVLRVTGDPAKQLLPDDTPPETVSYYRVLWGLDQPLHVQYVRYFGSVIQGDFGISFRNNLDALDLVLERVPKTLELMMTSFGFAVVVGISMGLAAAIKRDTVFDQAIMTGAVFGFSLPNFFLGIILILIFSLSLRWLPSSGSDTLLHLIMPAFTLGTAFAGQVARFSRSARICFSIASLMLCGGRMFLTSYRVTLTPHGSEALSTASTITVLIFSRSSKVLSRSSLPITLRMVV